MREIWPGHSTQELCTEALAAVFHEGSEATLEDYAEGVRRTYGFAQRPIPSWMECLRSAKELVDHAGITAHRVGGEPQRGKTLGNEDIRPVGGMTGFLARAFQIGLRRLIRKTVYASYKSARVDTPLGPVELLD